MSTYRWLITIGALLLASTPQAYELPATCQSVGHWKIIEGTCGANGKLQGKGTASFNREARFTGEFVDGLPHGRLTMEGLDGAGRLTQCEFDFDKGQIVNSELSCTMRDASDSRTGDPSPVLRFKVTSGSGRVAWSERDLRLTEGNPIYRGEGVGTLRVDLPQIEISSRIDAKALLPAANGVAADIVQQTGTADHLTLRFGDDRKSRDTSISLEISNFNNTLSSDFRLNTEVWESEHKSTMPLTIAGTFNWACPWNVRPVCRLTPFASPEAPGDELGLNDGKVDRRALIKLTTTSPANQYEYVQPSKKPYLDNWFNRVLYFKKDGFEFDATRSKCSRDERGAFFIGNELPVKTFDVRPLCGKVTMPDGRSFDGKYDRSTGKPILPPS